MLRRRSWISKHYHKGASYQISDRYAPMGLEQQIGYNKYFVRVLKEECGRLQESYYSQGKKPSAKKLKCLEDKEYMVGYYWGCIKERITELKRRKDLGVVIPEAWV